MVRETAWLYLLYHTPKVAQLAARWPFSADDFSCRGKVRACEWVCENVLFHCGGWHCQTDQVRFHLIQNTDSWAQQPELREIYQRKADSTNSTRTPLRVLSTIHCGYPQMAHRHPQHSMHLLPLPPPYEQFSVRTPRGGKNKICRQLVSICRKLARICGPGGECHCESKRGCQPTAWLCLK